MGYELVHCSSIDITSLYDPGTAALSMTWHLAITDTGCNFFGTSMPSQGRGLDSKAYISRTQKESCRLAKLLTLDK